MQGGAEPSGMALSRLQSLVRERDALCTPFQRAVDVLSKTAAARELDAWAQAALDLANANAGPGALLAFWQLTVQSRPHGDTAALVDAAQAAAEICRNSGAAAARAVLNVCSALGPAFWALI